MINFSFNDSIFPESLKVTRIASVPNKGTTYLPSDSRPISSLSRLSKIFECSAKDHLIEFCARSSVLYEAQFDFQSNKSTCDALLTYRIEYNVYALALPLPKLPHWTYLFLMAVF